MTAAVFALAIVVGGLYFAGAEPNSDSGDQDVKLYMCVGYCVEKGSDDEEDEDE